MDTAPSIAATAVRQPPHIVMVLDPARLFRWHLWLIQALAEATPVAVRFSGVQRPLHASLRLLIELERLTVARGGEHALDRVERDTLAALASGTDDADALILDLSGSDAATGPNARRLIPLFDGVADEAALWSALLERRAPRLSISEDGGPSRRIGQPALPVPHVLTLASDAVLSRLAQALAGIALGTRSTEVEAVMPRPSAPISALAVERFALNEIAFKAGAKLSRLLHGAPRWQVAWRQVPAPMSGNIDVAALTRLTDDGRRFYADPFVFCRDGRHYLFVEEFPYATRKGIISLVVIDADGTASTPRPVLERPYHLSYPQVFERDGQIWMMPESYCSGALELYRADPFPIRWKLEARLIEKRLHDATLVEHDGRLWIAAAEEAWASSSWDTLSLFHADRLLGPWTPHRGNPVLLCPHAARPGGRFVRRGGALLRPAQDSAGGYGSALNIARVTQLDEAGFAQDIVERVQLSADPSILGPHTLNWCGGLEAIDFFASVSAGIVDATPPPGAARG